ncbi:MAG: DMT family transporter, partial [Polyangiales bacterium]
YVLWYVVLRGMTTTRAAVVQLAVPVLAALGGVTFLSERVDQRLALASALILGGIAIAIWGRRPGMLASPPPSVDYPSDHDRHQ